MDKNSLTKKLSIDKRILPFVSEQRKPNCHNPIITRMLASA